MHTSEHHTIFYPSDPEELSLQCAERHDHADGGNLKSLPAAILAPHASYPTVLELLHQSFSAIPDLKPQLVVILAPLHQEALAVDRPHFMFVPTGEGIRLPHTTVPYAIDLRSTLLSLFDKVMKAEDSYFIEESAVELTLPLVDAYCKGIPVLPLLTDTRDAEQCRTYASIVKKIVALVPDTLFVVSANLNALLPSALALEHAQELVSLLERGEPLLESVRSKQISSCGLAAFEALRHQSWGKNGWSFTLFSTGGKISETLGQEVITKERLVWHASAKRKEV
ncbi:MAG TPA: AmmeMemoRadiSam system protein B [Sphaerochaeta sp.]|nr:AmmeMemoRadiSam system protein B [Sphaerochaeta sp.]